MSEAKSKNLEIEGRQNSLVIHARVVTGHGGGPDKTIITAPRYYQEFGYRGVCLYLRPPNDQCFDVIRKRAAHQGTHLYEVVDRGAVDPSVFWNALKICKQIKPAIWHGHDYKTNLLGLLLVRFGCPMQLVTTVHGWVKHTSRTPIYYTIDRMCIRYYDQIYCVSPDQIETCTEAGVPGTKLRLLDNAIDLRTFQRMRGTIQARKDWLRASDEEMLVGAMGRLSKEKGFDILIRAVGECIRRGRPIRLVIAGEGDQREELKRLIAEQGLQEKVELIGFCEDTKRFFESLDVFALSSLREGLPNVLLEAMALRVPVVSTRVAGVPRLISHDHNGLLVACGDEGALSDALCRLVENRALRTEFAEIGYQTIEKQFNFHERARQQCAYYDALR